jgi:hypothetical protein
VWQLVGTKGYVVVVVVVVVVVWQLVGAMVGG